MVKKIVLGIIAIKTLVVAGEYIIPPEYDNIVNSTHSRAEVLITNLNSELSSSSYLLGESSLKYRCKSVPKIRCANGYSPKLKAILKKGAELRESLNDQLVYSFATDIQVEDGGSSWRVCGGAIGGMVWDTVDGNETDITYTPNSQQLVYHFFTNISGNATVNGSASGANGGQARGSDKSFMIIKTEQSCEM